ncbi:acyl carrier protein [Kitasatospora sp. NPDC058162]|uniref:acyl carrier protein n=1 Tax=Kitasatospora sp. NPDC058162 TaxID=3346362 RepID=UPI0036DE03E3
MSTIDERVRKTVSKQLEVPEADAVGSARLVEDLGAASLDIVEVHIALEKEFDIEISDELASGIHTVQNAVDTVTAILRA